LGGFVRAVLFCRWLDAEQLGIWDMAFSFLLLAAPLSVLSIPGTFGRYVEHYRRRGHLREFLRWMIPICTGLALASCAAVLFARQWFAVLVFGNAEASDVIVLAAGCLFVTIVYNFFIELFTALRNIRLVSVMQLANSVAFAVFGVGLLLAWQKTAQSVLASYGASCLVAALMACVALRRVWRAEIPSHEPLLRGAIRSRIAPFAAWVLLINALANLFGVIDRYMIVHFSPPGVHDPLDVVGNYHSSRVVPLLLVSIATMLASMITPHLSHDWESGDRRRVQDRLQLFFKLFGFTLFAGSAAIFLAAPILFGTLFNDKFPLGLAVLPWTLVYCTWFGFAVVLQNYLWCAEKANLAGLAIGCGLALNIGLNCILLPKFGLYGAVCATTTANALLLGLICLFNRRLGFRLDAGAMWMLALPLTIFLGPWAAAAVAAAVAIEAFYGKRLLSPSEKSRIAQNLQQYGKLLGLCRA